jgi:hypothetical protein
MMAFRVFCLTPLIQMECDRYRRSPISTLNASRSFGSVVRAGTHFRSPRVRCNRIAWGNPPDVAAVEAPPLPALLAMAAHLGRRRSAII